MNVVNLTTHKVTIAPTEPNWLKAVADDISMLPETYGADILIESAAGRLGIQRKKFPDDLVASLTDNRLAKQLDLMRGLDHGLFVFEGRQVWTDSGGSAQSKKRRRGQGSSWDARQPEWITRSTVVGVQLSIAAAGFSSMWVKDRHAFVELVRDVATWWGKPEHQLTVLRPDRPEGNTRDARLAAALMVVPGVGVKAAKGLVAAGVGLRFDGASADGLLNVDGVGKKTRDAIVEQFG